MDKSTSDRTATMIVAASVAFGKKYRAGVRSRDTSAIRIAV